jgi:hypothetical protein
VTNPEKSFLYLAEAPGKLSSEFLTCIISRKMSSAKRSTGQIICGFLIALFVGFVIFVIVVVAYSADVYKNSSAPTITFYASNYSVTTSVSQFTFSGTSPFSIQNDNKVPITLGEVVFPMYYPSTNANGNQKQIGNCTLKGVTVGSKQTLNSSLTTNATNVPATTQTLMVADFAANGNILVRFNGTISASAFVMVYTVHDPIAVDCVMTLVQAPLGSTTIVCTLTMGTVSIGLK